MTFLMIMIGLEGNSLPNMSQTCFPKSCTVPPLEYILGLVKNTPINFYILATKILKIVSLRKLNKIRKLYAINTLLSNIR